jgi:ribose 5-phosphate isomerase
VVDAAAGARIGLGTGTTVALAILLATIALLVTQAARRRVTSGR